MRLSGVIMGIALALVLTGCTDAGGGPPAPTASATSTSVASPSAEPTRAPASPSPTAATASGCPANDVPVPADAALATIQDVDGDGQADAQFYTEVDGFYYGIRTASGATLLLKDDLAGPNTHSGWTSIREAATVTVLDDGRTATLHAFIDCGFVTTTDAGGTPYRFGLKGFSDYGTGVQCTDDKGGSLMYGVLASRQGDGTYDITRTQILLSDGGRIARNGSGGELVAEGLASDDDQVALAMRSTCGQTAIVHTSGR